MNIPGSEQNHRTVQQEVRNTDGHESPPSPNHNIVEVKIAAKKKKEIINLESSSERIKQNKPLVAKSEHKNQYSYDKMHKPKKTMLKCQLCKSSGKKVEMKTCIGCKLYFHLACLEQNEAKRKYLCDKCRAQEMSQSKVQKKQKKQQQKLQAQLSQVNPNTISQYGNNNNNIGSANNSNTQCLNTLQPNKLTLKKLEKQKRKGHSEKSFQQFQQKYPYYVYEVGDNEKIRYPIEDKLLYIYRDYFQMPEHKPTPTQHPLIPKKYLGDFLQLENFIVSFSKQFKGMYNGEHKKSLLYLIMDTEGSDPIFEQLIGAIIKIYLKDIFQKNKTQNVKILNDHSFFILLGTLNEDDASSQTMAIIAPEIIRHLSTVPSMKDAFKKFSFPQKLNLQGKLKTLIDLIQGLSEVDGFHDMVSRKSEKISQMTKDKADYVTKLKKNEAQALCNKEKIKQIQFRINENDKKQDNPQNVAQPSQNPGVSDDQQKKMNPKQIEKSRKKSQKLTTQHEVSSKLIKQFREKITDIAKTIPFTISEIMFLGSDRNKAYYYFYLREPHRIYVRYRAFCMDDQEDYMMYESKQKIVQLLKALNNKGINQKRLSDNINFLLKQEIIHNLSLEEQIRQLQAGKDQRIQNGASTYIHTQQQFKCKVIADIMDMEQKFSNYLAMKSCQWASQTKRQQFRFGFPYIDDIQAMKQAVKTLQQNFLFVEVFKQRDNRNNESDSHDQHMEKSPLSFHQKQLIRRKKPIRIWGINSEKVKKFWHQYLETCIDYIGIWISVHIFKGFVDKYLEKKLQHLKQQQRRENLQRQKQARRQIKQNRQKQVQQRKSKQTHAKPRATRSSNNFEPEYELSLEQLQHRRTNLRTRGRKPKNSRNQFTIDSDEDYVQNSDAEKMSRADKPNNTQKMQSQGQQQQAIEKNRKTGINNRSKAQQRNRKRNPKQGTYQQSPNSDISARSNNYNAINSNDAVIQDDNNEQVGSVNQSYQLPDEQMEQDSNNDQQCGICHEVGDVICCDTCPKVYHLHCLKLKQVPEGDWSCMDCLQKLQQTRQTRSRARKSGRK